MKAASNSLFHTDLQANFTAWLPNLFETVSHSPIDDRGKTNSRNEPVRLKNIRLGTQVLWVENHCIVNSTLFCKSYTLQGE